MEGGLWPKRPTAPLPPPDEGKRISATGRVTGKKAPERKNTRIKRKAAETEPPPKSPYPAAQAQKVRMAHSAADPEAASRTGRAALPEAASRTLARRAPNVYHPPAKDKDFAATRPPYPPAQAG